MKYINLFITLFIFIGCKKESNVVPAESTKEEKISTKNTDNNIKNKDTIQKNNLLQIDSISLNINEILNENLIGMEVSENKKVIDPYKKYSLDVSSACYSCDLAILKITKDKIAIDNYCDPEVTSEIIEIAQIINTKYKIELKNKQIKFIINKIDDAPIYNLRIEGLLNTKLKIDKYFIKISDLKKFEIHDCGDFEG